MIEYLVIKSFRQFVNTRHVTFQHLTLGGKIRPPPPVFPPTAQGIKLKLSDFKDTRLTLSGPGGLRGPDGQTHSCQSETSHPMMPKLGDF